MNRKQTWQHTWYEAFTNVVVGFILAPLLQMIYLRFLGYQISVTEVTGLGLFMTGVSILRAVIIRRIFEHIRIRPWE